MSGVVLSNHQFIVSGDGTRARDCVGSYSIAESDVYIASSRSIDKGLLFGLTMRE